MPDNADYHDHWILDDFAVALNWLEEYSESMLFTQVNMIEWYRMVDVRVQMHREHRYYSQGKLRGV